MSHNLNKRKTYVPDVSPQRCTDVNGKRMKRHSTTQSISSLILPSSVDKGQRSVLILYTKRKLARLHRRRTCNGTDHAVGNQLTVSKLVRM